ncbi:putative HTH-type transcriptional regulator [Listeria floridensis FSL S10-1187]|uniref:HTH-type transcriptional regulator n=1 Tax=Listeria floridensis FSL S10-1187 TaxID=1265817 RepID=A0ABN0RD12_9LIST|nr:helix-turn-helix transcriptional regulator [Listeria floridensis]EUJ28485.1 putative HTH-type transcriptional regulator [Listeria floridensis FSL S10-1187]
MFANKIKNLRKIENLTQKQLAEKIGVTRNTLANYEIGRREPDFATLTKIADHFQVSTDFLLDRNIRSINANKEESFTAQLDRKEDAKRLSSAEIKKKQSPF